MLDGGGDAGVVWIGGRAVLWLEPFLEGEVAAGAEGGCGGFGGRGQRTEDGGRSVVSQEMQGDEVVAELPRLTHEREGLIKAIISL